MPDPTTNFGWDVPAVGGDNNAWGTLLNAVFDDIDADLKTVKTTADAAKAATDALDADGVLDPVVGKKLYISYAAFCQTEDEDDTEWGLGGSAYVLTDNSDNPDMFASVSLPQGVTITQVDLICDKNTNTSVTVKLVRVPSTTGVAATVGTGSRSAAGIGAATISGLSEVVGDSFYTLEVEFAGLGVAGIKIYGAIITYTSHDLGETM